MGQGLTTMADPPLVRGLMRGLDVLHALNEQNFSTVLELSKKTGLPRPTVYRLLNTLVAAGYVTVGARKETYQLTIMVRSLSDGFDDEAWVTDVAGPILFELGQEVVWPTDLATFDRDAMVLRETTHSHSPLSINREHAGFRTPVLGSSLGKAYLANCPPERQKMILRHLATTNGPDAALVKDRKTVDHIIAQTLKDGYGSREGGMSSGTGSIAVPIMRSGQPVAAINMHYILSALSLTEVVERYLGPLRSAAKRIEAGLEPDTP